MSDRVVVVTGASGFIGRHVVDAFGTDGASDIFTVVPLTRSDVDLADRYALRNWLEAVRPEVVVHLAAALDRGQDDEAIERQWRDTFVAGRNLIQESIRIGVRHLLVAGSIEELGNRNGMIEVDSLPDPVTTYGLCKHLLCELARFEAAYNDVCVDWFRPFIVYGPGQSGDMVVPYAFRSAATEETALFSAGSQMRDFVFVDDLAARLVGMIIQSSESIKSGLNIHHLGSGVATRVADVVTAIQGMFSGADFRLGARSTRPSEPDLQVAPGPLLDEPTSLAHGLAETASWWQHKVRVETT